MDLPDLNIDMEDMNISLEDLENIEILEASFLSETRNTLIQRNKNQCLSNSDTEIEMTNPITWPKRRCRVIASDSESETDSVINFFAENIATVEQTASTYQK